MAEDPASRIPSLAPTDLLDLFCRSFISFVNEYEADLSLRQMLIFMICYLEHDEQTIRGLASALNMGRHSLSRSLDRLERLELVCRRVDAADQRSVLVHRHRKGWDMFEQLNVFIASEVSSTTDPHSRVSKAALPRTRPTRTNGPRAAPDRSDRNLREQ